VDTENAEKRDYFGMYCGIVCVICSGTPGFPGIGMRSWPAIPFSLEVEIHCGESESVSGGNLRKRE
jgi:hypothetical protein